MTKCPQCLAPVNGSKYLNKALLEEVTLRVKAEKEVKRMKTAHAEATAEMLSGMINMQEARAEIIRLRGRIEKLETRANGRKIPGTLTV